MSDPVWAYLERLPGKSAALFDWDKALSGWDRYPLFRDHFLQVTKSNASAVDYPTECGKRLYQEELKKQPTSSNDRIAGAGRDPCACLSVTEALGKWTRAYEVQRKPTPVGDAGV